MNKQNIKGIVLIYIVAIIILLAATIFINLSKTAITGFITVEKQVNYSDTINLNFNESSEYIWIPEHTGLLKSLRLSGSYKTEGIVKVYLEDNESMYLVFDSSKLDEGGIIDITGLAVSNKTEDKDKDKDKNQKKNETTTTTIIENQTTTTIPTTTTTIPPTTATTTIPTTTTTIIINQTTTTIPVTTSTTTSTTTTVPAEKTINANLQYKEGTVPEHNQDYTLLAEKLHLYSSSYS